MKCVLSIYSKHSAVRICFCKTGKLISISSLSHKSADFERESIVMSQLAKLFYVKVKMSDGYQLFQQS